MHVINESEGAREASEKPSPKTVWPNIRYASLGALLAWMYLVIDFGAWMTESDVANVSAIDLAMRVYLVSAAVLVLGAFLQRPFSRLFALRTANGLVAGLPTLGILMLVIGGPKLLSIPSLSPLLFQGGSILIGIGCALMILRVSQLYCQLDPSKVFLHAAFSELIVAIIFYFVIGNSWIVLIPDAPPLVNLLAVTLLPAVVVGLASIDGPTAPAADDDSDKAIPVGALFQALPPMGKLMIAVFVFSATASIVRNFFMLDQAPNVHQLNAQQAMLLRCLFAVALLMAAVFFSRKIALGKLYLLCMAALAVIVATLPLLNLHTTWPLVLTSALSSLIAFIVWCLLAFVTKSGGFSPFLVFGLGEGLSHGGLAIGYLCGYWNIFQAIGVGEGTLSAPYVVVLIALIVGCVVLVFTEKDFDRILEASGAAILNVRGAIIHSRKTAMPPKETRPWQTACHTVGERALLSQREQELLGELARNRTPQEIASHLNIAVSTVRTHTHRIYVKLDVHSRDELIDLVRMEYEGLDGR